MSARLGAPAPFAIGHRHAAPTCLVEQAVNAALDDALRDALALLTRVWAVTLAALAADFHRRMTDPVRPPCVGTPGAVHG